MSHHLQPSREPERLHAVVGWGTVMGALLAALWWLV